jgi:hypothetical protein
LNNSTIQTVCDLSASDIPVSNCVCICNGI